MIFYNQTIFQGPTANSLQACVATTFQEPMWTVPNFVALDRWVTTGCGVKRLGDEDMPNWWVKLCRYAMDRGWRVIQFQPQEISGSFVHGDIGIASVKTKGRVYDHVVLADLCSGEVLYDPDPAGLPEGHQLGPGDVDNWIAFVALK